MTTDIWNRRVDDVGAALVASKAFNDLAPAEQRDVSDAFAKVAQYLAVPGDGASFARQLAPDLSSLRSGGAPTSSGGTAPLAPPASSGAPSSAAPPGGAPPAGTAGPTSRVGDVTKATLSAIDFPSFVASLIQGTFQAIVDASIQQMEAYATLLKNAALTVDQFMKDNVTDGTARDYLSDRFGNVFERDTSGNQPRLRVKDSSGGADGELPSFFKGLGLDTPASLDSDTVESTVVPATRRMLAEQRQQTLSTMVLMGINRIVVSDGEISAKLQFHIDASETTQMRFDQQKSSGMNMSGTAGRNPFGAQGIMVNTASLNAQSALNVRADLVGNVVVRFRSETFPLERFADSAAIQLINTRAKVPPPAPAPAAPGAGAAAPGIASTAPSASSPPPPPSLAAPAPPMAGPASPAPSPGFAAAPKAQSFDDLWSAG